MTALLIWYICGVLGSILFIYRMKFRFSDPRAESVAVDIHGRPLFEKCAFSLLMGIGGIVWLAVVICFWWLNWDE